MGTLGKGWPYRKPLQSLARVVEAFLPGTARMPPATPHRRNLDSTLPPSATRGTHRTSLASTGHWQTAHPGGQSETVMKSWKSNVCVALNHTQSCRDSHTHTDNTPPFIWREIHVMAENQSHMCTHFKSTILRSAYTKCRVLSWAVGAQQQTATSPSKLQTTGDDPEGVSEEGGKTRVSFTEVVAFTLTLTDK